MSRHAQRAQLRSNLGGLSASDLRFLCGMLRQGRGGSKDCLVDSLLSSSYPIEEIRRLALELHLGLHVEEFVPRSVWADILRSNGLPSSGSRHTMLLTLVENRLFDPRTTLKSLNREQLNEVYYAVHSRVPIGDATKAIDDLLAAFDLDRGASQTGGEAISEPSGSTPGIAKSRQNENRDARNGHELVEIDVRPKPLDIKLASQLSIFISCGSDPAERESGLWLYETLRRSPSVIPFLWEQKSPGASPSKTLQDRLLQRARDSDGVIGFLHDRGSDQGQPFSLACYDEISAAATSDVPTLVFRTPGVRIAGMVLPHQEVRTIRRISETITYLRSWMASIQPRSPLWAVQILPVEAKRPLGKSRSAVLMCLPAELTNPHDSTTLHVRPIFYKATALSRRFMELLARDHRTGVATDHPVELVGVTEGALAELRNLRVPFFKEQDGE